MAFFVSGARLSALTSRLDTGLTDRGAAIDAAAASRIMLLFGAFFGIAALSIAMIVFSARYLARDISQRLAGLTGVARTFAAGRSIESVPGLDRTDEIGELAKAIDAARLGAEHIQQMAAERKTLREERASALLNLAEHFERTVGDVVGGVAAASSQLQATASAARSSDEVAGNIVQVREASSTTGAAASQVLTSATELEDQAGILSRQVQGFLAHVRAS